MRKPSTIIFMFFCGAAQAGLEEGAAAYQRGDYAAAEREFRVAAVSRNAQAQYSLGVMYERGLGVKQDDETAVTWYRLAAKQGDAPAQNSLGLMYANGRGVRQDDSEAVTWFSEAVEQNRQRLAIQCEGAMRCSDPPS